MDHSTLSERLLSEFSPRLDSALVLAIAADAGDGDQDEADTRATLQALADATSESSYDEVPTRSIVDINDNDDTSESTNTEATSLSTANTDDEAVERAFQAWTIEDSQLDEETQKDLSADFTSQSSATVSLDPISFLKNLFPKRERIELQVAFSDAGEDVEVRQADGFGYD